MDDITHIVLATAIAEAGFRKRLGGKAVFAAGVLASLPVPMNRDAAFAGPWEAMKYPSGRASGRVHRGPTHSLRETGGRFPRRTAPAGRRPTRRRGKRPPLSTYFHACGARVLFDADNNLVGVTPSHRRGGFSLRRQYDASRSLSGWSGARARPKRNRRRCQRWISSDDTT